MWSTLPQQHPPAPLSLYTTTIAIFPKKKLRKVSPVEQFICPIVQYRKPRNSQKTKERWLVLCGFEFSHKINYISLRKFVNNQNNLIFKECFNLGNIFQVEQFMLCQYVEYMECIIHELRSYNFLPLKLENFKLLSIFT